MFKNEDMFDRNLPAKFDGKFDWDFLKECWHPTKIEPTDIDAIVERYNKFLIFETKYEGREMTNGYRIMIENLLKEFKGNANLFYFHGKDYSAVTDLEEWEYDRKTRLIIKHPRITCDCNWLIKRVSDWFKYANDPNQKMDKFQWIK